MFDWEHGWDRARHDVYVMSDAYDTYCFDPLPERTQHPSRKGVSRYVDQVPTEPGNYMTRCPCHDDDQASLSILILEDGQLLVNCFAGCDWREVKDYLKR